MATALETSQVENIVQRGWRRRLLVLAVDQSAVALAFVFGGLALLILLGTQILNWPWLLGIFFVGVGLSVFRLRRQMTDAYVVAQMMDRQLAMHDALSTAWFIRRNGAGTDKIAARYQLDSAERLAQAADPAAAFPFERRKAWLITGAVGLLAFGLFGARYLVTRQLSLQNPFLPFGLTDVVENVRHAINNINHDEQATQGSKTKGSPPGALGKDGQPQTPAEASEEGQATGQQQGNQEAAANNGAPDQNAAEPKSGESQNGNSQPNGASGGPKSGTNEAADKQPSNAGQQNGQQQDGDQKSSSLMDKMRDALSSVMSKMKPAGGQQNSQSAAQKSADGQQGTDQSGSKDQSGDGQKESGKEQTAEEQSSGQQQGQGSAKAQDSGKDSAQASDKKGSDAQSGVGHSDGDKELKAAEQAKAMGKLAEIIGKRSANLTGDMQIEPSGKQRLQTEDTHRVGQHSDLGGEINRDEVPVEDQQYVREYMELVRKKPLKGTTSH